MHIEIRARIAVHGILMKHIYVSEDFLNKGATFVCPDESLPTVYVKYSDHYVNGQKITSNTVDFIYSKELHDCTKLNSYMGLWQIAQAAGALNVPIHSVYPTGGDSIMRQDFNRKFFPVDYNNHIYTQRIIIMFYCL